MPIYSASCHPKYLWPGFTDKAKLKPGLELGLISIFKALL